MVKVITKKGDVEMAIRNGAIGQLVLIDYASPKETWWEYGVVKCVFDNKTLVKSEKGNYILNEVKDDTEKIEKIGGKEDVDVVVSPFLRNGNPIILKKSFFGNYSFKKFY